ncbi:MAG: 30S ribosomal protein S6e [Candidatus Micrarchaeia archaeon]
MKIVIADPKAGNTFQTELAKGKEGALIGLKIGDVFDGALVGAPGYRLRITGGSDKEGFPMRADVAGSRRVDVLLSAPPGFRPSRKGERARKKVRGNVVSDAIAQLNTVVVEPGPKPLAELFPPKPKEKS